MNDYDRKELRYWEKVAAVVILIYVVLLILGFDELITMAMEHEMGQIDLNESRRRRIWLSIGRLVRQQVQATLRRPWRLFRWNRLAAFLRSIAGEVHGACGAWEAMPYDKGLLISVTAHADYRRYLRHQGEKVRHITEAANAEHFARYREVAASFHDWLAAGSVRSILCLGARRGAEVRAFRDLGYFAVGVDLEPMKENPYVVWGDFHHLPFARATVDCVFTNSIDHSLFPRKMLAEVRRVLAPEGLFILQAPNGSKDDPCHFPGAYEVFWWERIGCLIYFVARRGFRLLEFETSTYPHANGTTMLFQKEGK